MALDNLQPRTVTQQQFERLQGWSERKPCIALMGEFSAGKSTLLNFLIEAELLPTQITATELPPIWFSYGKEASFWVDQDWNQHWIEPKDLNTVPISARFARIHVEAEFLRNCDVIDTPGISDPNLAAESWRVAAGFANMVLWCTTATQAWRETERSTWLALPARLRRHSLLVVTRADKLQTEIDRDKVARRLRREAGDLFAEMVFVATHNAVKAKQEMVTGAPTPLWAQSGAATLMDEVFAQFEAIADHRRKMLARYLIGTERGSVLRLGSPIVAAPTETVDATAQTIMPVRPSRVALTDTLHRTERPGASGRPGLREGHLAPVPVPVPEPEAEAAMSDSAPATPDAAPARLATEARSWEPEATESEISNNAGGPEQAVVEEAVPADDVVSESPVPEEGSAIEVPSVQAAPQAVPHEVEIWREIVSKAHGNLSGEQVVSMIDELLCRLYGAKQAAAPTADDTAEETVVPEASPEVATQDGHARSWRRLA